MKLRKTISTIIFLCLVVIIYSQEREIDSLIIEAKIAANDESELINQLSNWQKAFILAKEMKSDYRLLEICKELGDLFQKNKIHDSAIEYYRFAIESKKDTLIESMEMIEIYKRIGQSYAQKSSPDSALIYYKNILNKFEYPDNVSLYRNIVDIYRLNGDYEKSLEYNLLIKNMLEQNSSTNDSRSKIYNNIAFSYHQLKEHRKAIEYFEKALNINSSDGASENATILGNLGISYFNINNTDRSLSYLNQAYEQSNNLKQKAEYAHMIAKVYMATKDLLRALKYYEFAENHARTIGMSSLLTDIFAGFSAVYNQTHEYDLAFENFKNYSRLRDSLRFVEELNRKRLIDNQKFIERTERENNLLKARQDFQMLQIRQLETETKNQALQTQALRSDSIRVNNELVLAQQKNELLAITEEKNELEISRQKNLIEITNQQLEIAKSNEERALIESEKRKGEIELAQEKLNLQKRDVQLKSEKEINEKKQAELERRRVQQRNSYIITILLALLTLIAGWAYRSKRKDNTRLSNANDEINKVKINLEEAEVKIRNLLKQQVSGAVAEALLMNSSDVIDEQKFVAIMFLDIRNFTVFCEGKKPSEIISFQNDVFGFMIDIIEKNQGIVNQLMGDGFMATFGAPLSAGNDCNNAFLAAKEIIEELENQVENNKVLPTKIGIGLHAGNVVTGNVGNNERKQYSITGNTVILAARLEQLNKTFGSTLVYSKELYDQLTLDIKEVATFKKVMVKGRSKPIEVASV